VLVEAALDDPAMFVDPETIGKIVDFSPSRHEVCQHECFLICKLIFTDFFFPDVFVSMYKL